jgi:predicted methyltransferase
MRSLRSRSPLSALAFVALLVGCEQKGPIFPQNTEIPVAPAQGEKLASPSMAQPPDAPEERTPPPEAAAPTPAPAPERTTTSEAAKPPPPDAAPAAPVADRPQPEELDVPADVAAIVDAFDRYESDRDLDHGRHPGELLAYLDLPKGAKVGELFAGKGYTTELLARRVGSSGVVWAENPPAWARTVGHQFGERLGKGVMQSTNRVDQPADAAWPAEAHDLDAIVIVLAYHDAVAMGVNRAAMNKAAFEALKKRGEYVIVDHSANPGRGTKDAKSLHRIDEETVIREVTAAGFQKYDDADFLRNPNDNRDWNASATAAGDKRGTSDRFVLRFVRP